MSKHSNAQRHGAYSTDLILPGESLEDFNALLNGLRQDFAQRGTADDEDIFDMAVLHWRKRRINRYVQFGFGQFAREVETSGNRNPEKVNYSSAVVRLSDAIASLADELKKNKSLGKLGANLRSVVSDIEELRPVIMAGAKPVDEANKIDGGLKTFRSACELEARIDAQIDKKIQRLAMIREFKRQYGQDSSVKLLPRPAAHGTSPNKSATEVGDKTSSKKSTDADDNWNNNDNDDDNDNEVNPNDYDWEHEYDEALAEQKARQARRARKD